jgi:hypothetical protein
MPRRNPQDVQAIALPHGTFDWRHATFLFRSAAQATYAAFRSVVSTAKLNNRSVLATPSSDQAAQPG